MQENERGREKDNLDDPSKLRNSAMALSMTASDSSILNVLSKHITTNEIAGYTVGALLLSTTISAPKIDSFISTSQRSSLGMCKRCGDLKLIACPKCKGSGLIKEGGPFSLSPVVDDKNLLQLPDLCVCDNVECISGNINEIDYYLFLGNDLSISEKSCCKVFVFLCDFLLLNSDDLSI
ncbi:hypothetical protein ACS0TY_000086 [Phlomoides rotata]